MRRQSHRTACNSTAAARSQPISLSPKRAPAAELWVTHLDDPALLARLNALLEAWE
ncbi:MAG: hypothetical protein AAF654_14590 [Myxococcota bacterium]